MSDYNLDVTMTRTGDRPADRPVAIGADGEPSALRGPRRWPVSQRVVEHGMAALDFVLVCLAGLIGYMIVGGDHLDASLYAPATIAGAIAICQILMARRAYRVPDRRKILAGTRTTTVVVTGVMVAVLAVLFFLKPSLTLSRIWMLTWYATTVGLLAAARIGTGFATVRALRAGALSHDIVLIGADRLGAEFLSWLDRHPESGIRVLGVFDDRAARLPDAVRGHDVLGTTDDLLAFIIDKHVDSIVVALPVSARPRIAELMDKLEQAPVDILMLADLVGFLSTHRPVVELCGLPVLHLAEKPMKDWKAAIKTVEDRTLTAFLLLMSAPLLAMIALAIKLDSPGPVFFVQTRIGFNNRPFKVWKFRTMYTEKTDALGATLTARNDPRITSLGRFLRKSSLDELPQLFNVLIGDMSLVGPRPHVAHATAANIRYDRAVAKYAVRHKVKPGITGWAQVNGWRGPTETLEQIEKRIEYDLYYIKNWSPAFDIWILFLTAFRGFVGQNAF